ncbi:MAG: BON domain-containing protein [Candidatus Eisenbacteria bacterium]|uniref:BON domain-containing protein n=1 Tax=Eiseniibacteriota bacterium TaxID=2212470 RepID=A0A849SFE3_UNCEI|nr:BON domain-containing protein [Candidatus Eisenbacteria bacterium]
MKRSLMVSLLRCAVVTVALGWAASSSAAPDPWVTAKVKIALMTSSEVSGLPIDVDTFDGRVTLHGKVATRQEQSNAAVVAGRVGGVRSVRNLLQVVSSKDRKVVNESDANLKDAVATALKNEHELDDSQVSVKSVNKGLVLLAGNAETLADHLRALETAAQVGGVKRLASEIKSPDRFADREIWDEKNPPSPGNPVSDAWITTETKTRFIFDSDIPASDINVDTHRGQVILFGVVPSQSVKDKALQIAKDVSGGKDAKDELQIVPPTMQARATADDSELEKSIRTRITDARLEGANVSVEVKAAVARLTGTYSKLGDRYEALLIARSTPGVSGVKDDMRREEGRASRD